MALFDRLREPEILDIDMDGVERLRAHREILERKQMIRAVFREIHDLMLRLESQFLSGTGVRCEIGAGVFPLRETDPDILATDIVSAPHLDRVLDAQAMDFQAASVKTVFGQHCFHHLPNPEKFFSELERVLVPQGGAILVEPYWGPVASVLYKYLFTNESFDKSASWTTASVGAMCGANQALSYIVFKRDREIYTRRYPTLPIVHQALISNHLRYLLSGGLNFRQLVPDLAAPILKGVESIVSPLNRVVGLHHAIVLRKSE